MFLPSSIDQVCGVFLFTTVRACHTLIMAPLSARLFDVSVITASGMAGPQPWDGAEHPGRGHPGD